MASFQSTPRIALSKQTADALGHALDRLREQAQPSKVRPLVFKGSALPARRSDEVGPKPFGSLLIRNAAS